MKFFSLILFLFFVNLSESFLESSGGLPDGSEKWGYVKVRPKAHMFYWLYRTSHENGHLKRPLILWLQGGPGGSSCGYGNFEIIGPLDPKMQPRNSTWVKISNILFVDNPVGTGYSYVEDKSVFTTNIKQITQDLIVLIKTFLDKNPEYKKSKFYIFGQSYGGKMGADFARQLYEEIQKKNIECNLAGYAMGNSWISPIDSTITWGPFIYWMSTTDENGLEAIQKEAMKCKGAVESQDWKKATKLWASTEMVVWNYTEKVDFYNILNFAPKTKYVPDEVRLSTRCFKHDIFKDASIGFGKDPLYDLMNGPIKKKLGIIPKNVNWDDQSDDVFRYQEGDFMKPVISVVDETLSNTSLEVIIYQGQLDIICDTKAAMDWVQKLKWPQIHKFLSLERKSLFDPKTNQPETFVKALNKFKFYWLLKGGHSAPADTPEASFRMLERIFDNKDK